MLCYCHMKERIDLEEIMHISHKQYSVSHSIPCTELYIRLGLFSCGYCIYTLQVDSL